MGLFDNQKKAPVTPPPPAQKVLIVEDEKDLSDALAEKLKSAGFSVAQASNGQAGLDIAPTFNPNIILLDLMMPVMDGKLFLHHLRGLPQFKNLPVIVLTNAGNVDNIHETQTYFGVNDFLIKANVDMDQVVAKIKNLLPPPVTT